MRAAWWARRPGLAILPIWLCVSAVLMLISPHLSVGRFPDADDIMRLMQVRDLMEGQGWFDLRQYRLNAPEGTLMHWSRLVDLPLAGLIGILSLVLPAARAENIAVAVMPLLVLLPTMLAVGRLAFERMGLPTALAACALFLLMPLLPAQFQPLRIDHHSWQILAVAVALWAIFRPDPARGGLYAGLAMAAGLTISLETVVMAAGFAGVLTLRWLIDPEARIGLVRYLQALGGGLAALFLLTRGLGDLAPHCDAIAPAHLGLFAIAAIGVTVLAAFAPASRVAVLGGLAASAIAGIAFVGLTAPACLASPFSGLDPLVRDQWYRLVSEGLPIWHRRPGEALAGAFQCLLALAIAVRLALAGEQGMRRWWRDFALVLAVATLAGFATFRSIAFAGAIATIPVAWLALRVIAFWSSDAALDRRFAAAAGLLAALLPGAIINPLLGLLSPTLTHVRISSCALHENAVLIDRLPTGIVFAQLDTGPDLLLHTRHSIVASGHHRAQAGMREVIAAFNGDAEAARRRILANRADYLVLCMDIDELRVYRTAGGPGSFAGRLAAGDRFAWLEPVELGTPASLKVWRVRPAAP